MIDRRRFRAAEWAGLGAIVALAGTLRLAYLPARGLVYWDEGKFALEGIRIEVLLQALAGGHAYLSAGKAVGTAKPTHALLIAFAFLILGIHDYSATLMSAVASVAGVLATYFIGRRLFGVRSALVGALLLAVSEYDAIYARSVLSESDATFIMLAGIAVWLATAVDSSTRSWTPHLDANAGTLIGASLIGLAFTANYRVVVYAAVFFGFDWTWIALRAAGDGRLRSVRWQLTRRVMLTIVGFCVAPAIWELIGVIAQSHGIDLFHSELTGQRESYFQQVAYQLHGGKQASLLFNPLLYLQWWVVRQGWLLSVVLLMALFLALWRRSYPWLLAATMVVLPYAIYVFAPFAVPRNLVASIPFASLLCGAAIVAGAQVFRRFSLPMLVASALLLGLIGGVMSWRLTAERSGFALAARYVSAHAGGKALTSSEVMVFYLRGSGRFCLAPALPYHLRSLAGYEREGYRLVVVDRHHGSPMVDLIEHRSPRVAAFPALGSLSIGESPISSENSDPPSDAQAEYVDVYRLGSLPGKAAGAPPCQRDEVT